MAKTLGPIKLLLWIGVFLFLFWFLIFTFAPQSILNSLEFIETEGYFLRMFGLLPLSWALLFLYTLKDVEKNIAIIRCAEITADLVVIANVVYHFAIEKIMTWFVTTSIIILFVYTLLLYVFRPKSK